MKTNFKRLFKLVGILTAVVIVTLTGIYFIQTRTIASNRTYKAVTVNVEAEETTADSTEAVTEEQQTTENTTTAEETVATTEEIETATTEAVTETAAVHTIVTEAATETVPETEMVPETAAAAVTEPVTEVHKTTSQVNNSDYTNVVFKNATDTYKFDTLTVAKEAVNVKRLSDEAARSLAKSNEPLYASQVEELVGLINEYRTANGLNKVDLTANLTDAAMHRAAESAYSDWNMTAYENGSKRHIRPNFEKSSEVKAARPSPPASLTISSAASAESAKAPARPSGAATACSIMRRRESSSKGRSSTTRLLLIRAELTSK